MHLLYLLASLSPLTKVIADHANTSSIDTGQISEFSTLSPLASNNKNITFPDGTTMVGVEGSCWDDPVAPPVASNSTRYDKGMCSVCVSQSLLKTGVLTLGTMNEYHVQVRDSDGSNHDMGSVSNVTLAAYGAETGGRKTLLTMTVARRLFHLWAMRDPGFPDWAAVYMDWGGPGPADPFAQPPMVYSAAGDLGEVQSNSCGFDAFSLDQSRVYFSCAFVC